MRYRLGSGSFATMIRRSEPEGAGDWFEFSVSRFGPGDDAAAAPAGAGDAAPAGAGETTLVGAIWFPRRDPGVPATLADGGGTWTEFWDNNGPVLVPVPLWMVRVDPPVANGTTPAEGVTLRYSRMPNSVIDWDPERGQVVTTIGGSTTRGASGPRTLRIR
jgi:hypothetical protein